MERLAIIGGGISGLACAYRLQKEFDITVFEKEPVLGGHAKSLVTPRGNIINHYVFGYVTELYKHFFQLMDDIGFHGFRRTPPLYVLIHDNGKILHADVPLDVKDFVRNLPTFLDFRTAPSFLHSARHIRFMVRLWRDYKRGRFPKDTLVEDLVRYYPEHKAIIQFWAVPFAHLKTQVTLNVNDLMYLLSNSFSLKSLLARKDLWLTASGGCTEYIEVLASKTKATFKTSTPVEKLEKRGTGYEITAGGEAQRFDRVIVATQPLDVHKFLKYWDPAQRTVFEGLEDVYDPTVVVVHTDVGVMCGVPKRLWGFGGANFNPETKLNTVSVYTPRLTGYDEDIFVTYMNRFDLDAASVRDWKNIDWSKLPPGCRIDPSKILDASLSFHPFWGIAEQRRRFKMVRDYCREHSAREGLYFCGTGLDANGMVGHEGAMSSAVEIIDAVRKQARRNAPVSLDAAG